MRACGQKWQVSFLMVFFRFGLWHCWSIILWIISSTVPCWDILEDFEFVWEFMMDKNSWMCLCHWRNYTTIRLSTDLPDICAFDVVECILKFQHVVQKNKNTKPYKIITIKNAVSDVCHISVIMHFDVFNGITAFFLPYWDHVEAKGGPLLHSGDDLLELSLFSPKYKQMLSCCIKQNIEGETGEFS